MVTRKLFTTVDKDNRTIVRPVHDTADPDDDTPGAELSIQHAADYRNRWGSDQVLDVFIGQNGFRYLFDSTPAGRSDFDRPANRVVAAWGYSKPDERVGDRRMLRGFPLPATREQALDRGHLIALASGGGESVNLVPQASGLNRGYTEQGKRWRALERYCAATPGVFIYVVLGYEDVSDIPAHFDFHIVDLEGGARSKRFTNRDD